MFLPFLLLTGGSNETWMGVADSAIWRLVSDLFRQINELFHDTDALKNRYGITPLNSRRVIPSSTDIESQRCPTRSYSMTIQARWAVTDKMKFEQLIGDLKYFNDSLYSLLPLFHRRSLETALPSQILPNISAPQLESVRTAAQGIYADLSLTANLRAISVSTNHSTTPVSTVAKLHLNRGDIILPEPTGRGKPLSGFLTSQDRSGSSPRSVLIEWKYFDDDDITGPNGVATSHGLDILATLLSAKPKPDDFRVLDCIGYFHDYEPGRVGFVFDIPSTLSGNIRTATSLFELLGSERVPELGYRFRVAQSMSTSLLQIHAAGWLHKSIRSQNIIFFATPSIDESSPYLVGFDMARLDGSKEISPDADRSANIDWDIYRHPHCQGVTRRRHTMAYDRFSFGLILLEIGFWRQLKSFWKAKYSPGKFLSRLLEFHVPELDSRMGRTYRDVVKACLNLEAGGLNDGVRGDLFYWRVVKELESCRV